MTRPSERAPLIVLGAFSALIILGGLAAALLVKKPAPSTPERDTSAKATEAPVVVPSPAVPPPRPAPSAAPSAAKAASNVWPEPLPIPGVRAITNPNFGDPFDGDGNGPKDVRVLATVGAFRVGVTNDSKVRDEAATVAVLKELGAEIDEKDRERTDSYERRVIEYQSIFDRYRDRLKPVMDGSFAVKGNGWSDTEQVVHPHAGRAAPSAGHAH